MMMITALYLKHPNFVWLLYINKKYDLKQIELTSLSLRVLFDKRGNDQSFSAYNKIPTNVYVQYNDGSKSKKCNLGTWKDGVLTCFFEESVSLKNVQNLVIMNETIPLD